MAKLSSSDKTEIQKKYLQGQSTESIAELYAVSGQYIRQLIKKEGWKELKEEAAKKAAKQMVKEAAKDAAKQVKQENGKGRNNVVPASTARELALLAAKSPDNFRKDTPIVREFILDELRKGVSLNAACKSVGIDHKTLKAWREKDPEYDLRCHESQGDFLSGLERLAAGVSTPSEALRLLQSHPLSKDQWQPRNEKGGMTINLNFDRNAMAKAIGENAIDTDYEVVDTPQIAQQTVD